MRLGQACLLMLASCATIASPGSGDQNLPTSGVGPFQALSQMQIAPADLAPYVFLNVGHDYTEPTVVAGSGDPSSTSVVMYVVDAGVIVRTRADDGRSFYADSADAQNNPSHRPVVALKASLGWESTALSGPSALRVDSQIWLYYAAAGGIGLAKSSDGLMFTKTGQPVLGLDQGVAWEFTPPRAPTVAVFPDGSWHMLFASGNAIGEATSSDGESWTRVDGDPSTPALDPVLAPSTPVDPTTLPPGEHPPFDEGSVDDPLLVPRVDETGHLQVRVLYTGYGTPLGTPSRAASIGFAARYGDAGQLSRQAIPIYMSAGAPVSAPALFEWSGPALLYASQLDTAGMPAFSAIAAAYDPTIGSLPSIGAFPASP